MENITATNAAPLFIKPLGSSSANVPGFLTSFMETDIPIDIDKKQLLQAFEVSAQYTETHLQIASSIESSTQYVSGNQNCVYESHEARTHSSTVSFDNISQLPIGMRSSDEQVIGGDRDEAFYRREELETELNIHTRSITKSQAEAVFSVDQDHHHKLKMNIEMADLSERESETEIPIMHTDENDVVTQREANFTSMTEAQSNYPRTMDSETLIEQIEVSEISDSVPVFVSALRDYVVSVKEDFVLEVIVCGNPTPTVCLTANA